MNAPTSVHVLGNLTARGLLELLDEVCSRRGVTRDELCSRRRSRALSQARHELWCLILEHPDRHYSHNELGRLFERDHTTILSGVRTHRRRLACDSR